MGGTEKRDLKVEELEHRVAPMGLVYTEPVEPDPTQPAGSGETTGDPIPADQPGNSDPHRRREFKQNL